MNGRTGIVGWHLLCVGKKRRSNARFYEEFKILSKTASL